MKKLIFSFLALFIVTSILAVTTNINSTSTFLQNNIEHNEEVETLSEEFTACDCYIVTVYVEGKKLDDWYEKICGEKWKREDFLEERYTKMGHKSVRVNTSPVKYSYCD